MSHADSPYGHVPVLKTRITELLGPGIEAAQQVGRIPVVLDGTLGAGGHAEHVLSTYPEVYLIGVDRDVSALEIAQQRLAPFGDRFAGVHARFDHFAEAVNASDQSACQAACRDGLAGALFDFGVSSMQLDQVERGFAYRVDAPLDMRMDPDSEDMTAADIVNTYSHGALARVLKDYGDERFAGKIASAILRERQIEPFSSSKRLVDLLYSTIPAASRRTGGHPAKRTFQALRIEVNRELESIENVLPEVAEWLAVDGRLVVMSYQSLEDRIAKREFKRLCASSTPEGLPMELPGTEPEFRQVTRGAEKANQAEREDNPRAAPVRVRAIARTYQKNQKSDQKTAMNTGGEA